MAPFYKRRAIRILPAYWAAVIIVFCVELLQPIQARLVARPVQWYDLLSHLALLQTLFGSTAGSINGSFWTIALEAQLYATFPLLLLLMRSRGPILTVAISVAVAVLWWRLSAFWVTHHPAAWLSPDLNLLLPARWFEFVLGMCAALVVARPRRVPWIAYAALVLVGVRLSIAGDNRGLEVLRVGGWGIAAFGLVLLLERVPRPTFDVVPLRLLSWFGLISYSFYLLHQPLLLLVAPEVKGMHLGTLGTYALAGTVGIGAISCIAWPLYRLAEKPALVSGGMRQTIRRDDAAMPSASAP